MSKMNDNLTKIFNIEEEAIEGEVTTVDYKESSIVPVVELDTSEQKENDFDQVRRNMYELLSQGTDLLEDAIHIARESEQPKSFEVAATIMKQLTEMNSQILNLHQKRQYLDDTIKKKEVSQPTNNPAATVTNNTMFVGTTADLNNIIEQMGMKNVTKS